MSQSNKRYIEFIENDLKIVDKKGKTVPFKLNSVQRQYMLEDSSYRDIILKARQQGFSSLILAVFAYDFLFVPNTYNVVVADSTDNAQGLLERVKFYINTWCEKYGIDEKDIFKYNTKYKLFFKANNSNYIIGTAENKEVGRSKTITNLHLSEAAFYPEFEKLTASIMQAVIPKGRIIIETTANGFNQFRDYWVASQRKETPFQTLFYRAGDFYDEKFLAQKRKELGRLYPQEYPDSPDQAFLVSGESYFDIESLRYFSENVQAPLRTTYEF